MKLLLILLTASLCQQASPSVSAPSRTYAAQSPSAAPPDAAKAQGLEGIWQGTLEAGGAKLRLVIKVTKSPDGTLAATLDSPDQGATGIPVDSITFTGAAVRFELKSVSGVYEGTINKEGTAIDGRWSQGPGSFPLVLTRVERAPAGPSRPQTPKGPYPYDAEEVSYENRAAGVRLAGTLTLPRAKGPHPAVLLISGSGQQDRDETVYGHKPFHVLADYLTRRGVAVLRVDDRGVGGSSAGPDLNKATSEDFAGDVLAGVEYLRSRKEIDPKKVGLVGHSEGGMIAPMVASRSADVAFIVLLAGPGLAAEEGFAAQVSALARANGASEDVVAWRRRLLARVFSVMKAEKDDAAALRRAHEERAKLLGELSAEQRKRYGLADDEMEAIIRLMLTPWFRFFTAYDPRATLMKVRVPVLALAGERDLQVVPAKEHLAAVAAALKAGGNRDYTVKELPKLNHLLQTSETGSPAEYGRSEETMSPAALELIGDWILSHAGTTSAK